MGRKQRQERKATVERKRGDWHALQPPKHDDPMEWPSEADNDSDSSHETEDDHE